MNDAATLDQLGLTVRHRELGPSQESLTEKAGLDRNYIGSVRHGERTVGFHTLVQIASALEITLVGLMRMEDDSMVGKGNV